jgi:Cdc6-like AAA superfamily ATPase
VGIRGTKDYFHDIERKKGGVVFIDEAHRLLTSDSEQVLWFILEEIEKRRGQIAFIFAGTERGLRDLLGAGNGNVGSLLPHVVHFEDFTDEELLKILIARIEKRFNGKMRVEGGIDGVYMRVAARRVGRSRGGTSFGNARTVENLFALIWQRQ